MKRGHVTFGLVIIFAGLVLSKGIYAQKTMISFEEFDSGTSRYTVTGYKISRREERREETLIKGAVTKSILTIYDVLLPGRERVLTTVTEAGRVRVSEEITIDRMIYSRKDGGKWTKGDRQSPFNNVESGGGELPAASHWCNQFSVEVSSVRDTPTALFTWLLIDGTSKELLFREQRHWIGGDGLQYRKETVKGKVFPREETYRGGTTFQYEPKDLKIEAPIK